MTTVQKHTAKNLGDGKYEYRGVPIRKFPDTPPGYWGHWRTYFHPGLDLRAGSLKGLLHGIDEALIQAEQRRLAQTAAEEAAAALALKRETAAQRYASAMSFHAAPWHVEDESGPGRDSYAVYHCPEAQSGSRSPVADRITQEEVARLIAHAPDMLAVLRWAKNVMEQNQWNHPTVAHGAQNLHSNIVTLIDKIEGV